MRRSKFPKNLEKRKRLIRYLEWEGYTIFDIKLLIGYAFDRDERSRIDLGFMNEERWRLLSNDEYRKSRVEELQKVSEQMVVPEHNKGFSEELKKICARLESFYVKEVQENGGE